MSYSCWKNIQKEDIRTRVLAEAKNKFGSLSKASEAIGKTRPFLYGEKNLNSLKKIIELCKAINVSVEYALTGENKKPYSDFEVSFSELFKTHKSYVHKIKIPKAVSVVICKLKKREYNNLSISTLVRLSNLYQTNPYKLIGG